MNDFLAKKNSKENSDPHCKSVEDQSSPVFPA
jgi:hypothetical protein